MYGIQQRWYQFNQIQQLKYFIFFIKQLIALFKSHLGSLLATASKKGTLIRILDVYQQEVKELRRGSNQAIIQAISFKEDDRFLACSSDTGTIHIFNLQGLKKNKYSSLKFMNGIFSYFGSQWSFHQVQIKDLKDQRCYLCFPPQHDDILTVLASNGMYFLIEFDKEKGTIKDKSLASHLF